MKLILILAAIATIVLVFVGHEWLMKAVKKRNNALYKEIQDVFDEHQKQQTEMENLKSKIISENQPTTKKAKTKTNGK